MAPSPSPSITAAVRRRVSSAAASRGNPLLAEIKPLLDSLEASNVDTDILVRLQWLSLLKRVLVDSPDAKDTFRTLKGFQCLLSTLHSLAGFYSSSSHTEEEKHHFIELAKCLFGVISEALSNHPGNRRFFARRIGWDSLQQGLAATGLPTEAPDQLFGLLLSFGMDDATLSSLIVSTKRGLAKEIADKKIKDDARLDYIREKIGSTFGPKDVLLNTEIVPLVIGFQIAMPQSDDSELTTLIVLQSLLSIASGSEHNLVAMHSTGILSTLLPRLWTPSVPIAERAVLRDLASRLIHMGVNHMNDAKEIYKKAMRNEEVASFLLSALQTSREPPHIQFDLSLYGYASLELPTLVRPFPPMHTSGYTFSAWIYIESFDPSMHTTIFGVFDSTQSCFVLAYIEQDTKKFILQTSVSSRHQASVRFKTAVFDPKRWYHIAIVHRRGRPTSSAKAALYIDGEFVEQQKTNYPSQPPSINTPTQVFFGTPSDLSPRCGRGVISSRWSLGTTHLFEDILSDDLIAVFFRLGPRYHGNFQDCLGSFQTYEASAALNMRNELMHPGREEKSDIVAAIRQKASAILPEGKLLLSLSATQVLDDRDDVGVDENILTKNLSKQAVKNLKQLVASGAVAINGAVPSINEALQLPHGVAVMTGSPIVAVPQSLDDAAWKIGGAVAVGLKMVEVAKTKDQVCLAVRILFEMIKSSWRNSEAMERESGFSILSHLIRQKEANANHQGQGKGIIGKELLRLVLEFVGYRHDAPEESFIINPLAYRVLIVDFDVWRTADLETQREYFGQFWGFAKESKYHHFNSKRLVRMRIVKKLLFALKAESFSREILPDFLRAFRALVKANMSADVLRSLSLFITYSLHKHNPSRPLRVKKSNIQMRRPGSLIPGALGGPMGSSIGGSMGGSMGGSILGGAGPKSGYLGIQGELNEEGSFTRQQIGVMILEMYEELLAEEGNGMAVIKKFAKTVTNKWLLYLLAESDPQVVVLGTKIIARLLISHGPNYVNKFTNKTGGFVIMKNRLKRWWNVAPLWPICFCILFGKDVAKINTEGPLDLYELLSTFASDEKTKVVYPEVLPVIAAMLKAGVGTVVADSPLEEPVVDPKAKVDVNLEAPKVHARKRSLSLNDRSAGNQTTLKRLTELTRMLQTLIQFITHLHASFPSFRDFCVTSPFIQETFSILFPVVCSSDHVSAETELNSRDSALTFDGGDVVIRPLASNSAPIVRTITVEDRPTTPVGRLRRGSNFGSAFILVTQEATEFGPSTARLTPGIGSNLNLKAASTGALGSNMLVESLMELVMAVFGDMVFERKEFSGFGLNTKIPPGFQEHQIYFETYLLKNVIVHIRNQIGFDMGKLAEPKVLQNVARFAGWVADCVYEGWFLNGSEPLLDFVGFILEYLQRPDIAKLKSVRLCTVALSTLRSVVSRLVLFRLSELDDPKADPKSIVEFLGKMMYWQAVILSPDNTDGEFTRLICYLLYTRLIDMRTELRMAAADMLRIVMVQKPTETTGLLNQAKSTDHKQLSSGFRKLQELDNETWLYWIDDHRKELDAFFYGALSKSWEAFVGEENRRTEETAKQRITKRKEKLKQWIVDDLNSEDVFGRHESISANWSANIFQSEHLKYQRAAQDQQDTLAFTVSQYARLESDLCRPCGLLDDGREGKWRLDLTEGRNRMRKRMLPDESGHLHNYQPKRRLTTSGGQPNIQPTRSHALSVDVDEISIMTKGDCESLNAEDTPHTGRDGLDDEIDDDYELVNDPREDDDGWEDKNRKVMRSIQHGDAVEFVNNVSRLVGLDAVEGLLIIGKNCLYLIDNFFQRSDGEIMNVWQAPKDERDQYLQIISGRASEDRKTNMAEHEARHWGFEELISISKRKFLFRDVALELFFADGRSYLLTTMSVKDRDFVYTKLLSKATSVGSNPATPWTGDVWRSEASKTLEAPTNFGMKLANVFSVQSQHPATRKWMKGEISNFHYLMLINTMAGRTFNDLTQYPVFPWVLADYTSEELDLSNPRTFRDFSKPMGAQTVDRQNEFRDRYRSFEEIADSNSPPFHYGTHFSSAMIVCSYLIRLQPFVQSYLLLQGGQFDHADRLFYSIEKAWSSASRENMSDVRELIPEFFFLPEFLTNSNGYNFGLKQGTDEPIDHVSLPPWAKGDPKIFIAKHREALESPYVSQHLHEWIDLIFGYKQRGEAAIEATNVFHHLSYSGAIDLDNIADPVERIATIGIIHNFGQTPHQVFTSKPHPKKDPEPSSFGRLDLSAESLIRLPFPLLSSNEKVASLSYNPKVEKVFCAGPNRLNIPPTYERFIEWGYTDGSVRFFTTDTRKLLGVQEHLHGAPITAAVCADSKTLVTAAQDGTVSVWSLRSTPKTIDLVLKSTLFAHTSPVTVLALSRSFSTLISCSADNLICFWDLNRLRFIRKLPTMANQVTAAAVNDVTGEVVICTGHSISIYTINGELLCRRYTEEFITCVKWYEGVGNEWMERELLVTGHKRGVAVVWGKYCGGGWGSATATATRPLSLIAPGAAGSATSAAASPTTIRPQTGTGARPDTSGRPSTGGGGVGKPCTTTLGPEYGGDSEGFGLREVRRLVNDPNTTSTSSPLSIGIDRLPGLGGIGGLPGIGGIPGLGGLGMGGGFSAGGGGGIGGGYSAGGGGGLSDMTVTAMELSGEKVYTADEGGRVYEWGAQMVQRSRSPLGLVR